MRRVKKLEIVWQRPATKKEIREDAARAPELRRLVGWKDANLKLVSYRDVIEVDIPVGPGFESGEVVKRVCLRALVSTWEPRYKYYYIVATMERTDGTELFRTITPRTEISPALIRAAKRSK